jgi:hypothetical protein
MVGLEFFGSVERSRRQKSNERGIKKYDRSVSLIFVLISRFLG